MTDEVFACKLSHADLVRGLAPPQPEAVAVGQVWMRCEDGASLPVKAVRDGFVDLGGSSYTMVLSLASLLADWVCTDPSPVVQIAAPTNMEGRPGGE